MTISVLQQYNICISWTVLINSLFGWSLEMFIHRRAFMDAYVYVYIYLWVVEDKYVLWNGCNTFWWTRFVNRLSQHPYQKSKQYYISTVSQTAVQVLFLCVCIVSISDRGVEKVYWRNASTRMCCIRFIIHIYLSLSLYSRHSESDRSVSSSR